MRVLVPEVIKGGRVDLLSENVSYSWICDNVRVEQSQAQSQQPAGVLTVLFQVIVKTQGGVTTEGGGVYLNRGPMAATWRFRLLLAPPTFRDSERCSRLQKIST